LKLLIFSHTGLLRADSNKMKLILSISLIAFSVSIVVGQDTLRFSGQLSSWINAGTGSDLPFWGGVRYIPQVNYGIVPGSSGLFDAEASVNIYGNAGLHPFDSLSAAGDIKPYRVWVRYSTDQLEIRLGLQKLSFGSSSMLRPLMWFDQLDPRDPLQLTDGVWGLLTRYYFLNNSNIWLWGLFGNNEIRGWETIPVNSRIPEFGGRFQFPIPGGEAALTYHHRIADSREAGMGIVPYDRIPENRIGLDAKWNLKAGFWLESSFTHKGKDLGMLTNQLIINAGIDYTFPAGNGIYAAFEQLIAAFDEKPFSFSNNINFSLLTMNYPLGLFDRISTILYYNWTDKKIYSFVNWQRQFDRTMFYIIAYWNPESFQLPTQTSVQSIFAGKGIQLMFVFNH